MQQIIPEKIITVTIKCYSTGDSGLVDKYMAYLDQDDYRAVVAAGSDLPDVLKELSISIKLLEDYREQNKK